MSAPYRDHMEEVTAALDAFHAGREALNEYFASRTAIGAFTPAEVQKLIAVVDLLPCASCGVLVDAHATECVCGDDPTVTYGTCFECSGSGTVVSVEASEAAGGRVGVSNRRCSTCRGAGGFPRPYGAVRVDAEARRRSVLGERS